MRRLVLLLSVLLLGLSNAPAAGSAADTQVRSVLAKLMTAWAAGDAVQFSLPFSEDADFIFFFGARVRGRKAIAEAHQQAFSGPLKGTRVVLDLQSVREVASGVLLVHTLGKVVRPDTAADSPPTSIQTFLMVARNGNLSIEAFQNTSIQPPPGSASPR